MSHAKENQRANEFSKYQYLPTSSDSDNLQDASCRIMATFLESGDAEGIPRMTNFTATETKTAYGQAERFQTTKESTYRGKKPEAL